MAFKIPKIFAAGTKAKADDVNENFTAIENEINNTLQPGLFEAGDLKSTARAEAPDGWLLCDGSPVSRATYKDLFAAIGTTYGAGDGVNTFNIPDLRGRVPVGVDGAAGRLSENDTLGKSGGHRNMPAHSHAAGSLGTSAEGNHTHWHGAWTKMGLAGGGVQAEWLLAGSSAATAPAGGHAHAVTGSTADAGTGPSGGDDRMQPFLIVNFLIKI